MSPEQLARADAKRHARNWNKFPTAAEADSARGMRCRGLKYDVERRLTLAEIAWSLGVTPQYIHIVEKRAMAKLRKAAERLGIERSPWGGERTWAAGFVLPAQSAVRA